MITNAPLDTVRQNVATEVETFKVAYEALYGPLQVEYENRDLLDPAAAASPFLAVEIYFNEGRQLDLSPNPIHKQLGQIVLTANTREGGGTAQATNLLDYFLVRLQMRRFGVLLCHAGSFAGKPTTVLGWVKRSVMIPFEVNRIR